MSFQTNESLLDTARRVSAAALASGKLRTIDTDFSTHAESGVEFQLRCLSSIRDKQQSLPAAGTPANPFLPYDEDLFVTDLDQRGHLNRNLRFRSQRTNQNRNSLFISTLAHLQ